jgi:hypothetical protein
MELAPSFVCLAVVAAVSAAFGALVPPPPGPALDANAAEAAEQVRRAEVPYHQPAGPAARAGSVEAIRLSGRLPADLRGPSVVAVAGGWRMWFVAQGAVREATSNDGRDWRPVAEAVQIDDPRVAMATPTVLRRADGSGGAGGLYRMWYEADGAIRLATSADGRRFTPRGEALTGVAALGLEPGAQVRLSAPEAAYRDGRYHLWFVAETGATSSLLGSARSTSFIGHATSFDGATWRASTANPLPTLPEVGAGRPSVAWDQAAGRFAIWYRDAAGGWRHATSPDGDMWGGAAEAQVAAADAVAVDGGLRVYAAAPPAQPSGLLAGLLGLGL